MKFRTETHRRLVDRTIGGITNQIPETYTERVPVLPRDWDTLALRAASGLVLALTVVSVVWSTYSIGVLLGGGVGFAAAVVFDLAWMVNVLLEWLSRFDAGKRGFSRRLGWALLAATMGAILWHGLLLGSAALGVVGAGVSLFAKVLWMGIMRFVDRDLSEADAAWVAAEMSKANAKLAVAGVRRQAALAEQRATLELLAAERTLGYPLANAEANTLADLVPSARSDSATNTQQQDPANSPNMQADADVRDDADDSRTGANTVALAPANAAANIAEQPSIADLARQQVRIHRDNREAVAAVMAIRPDAKRDSVAAIVRRERTNLATYP